MEQGKYKFESIQLLCQFPPLPLCGEGEKVWTTGLYLVHCERPVIQFMQVNSQHNVMMFSWPFRPRSRPVIQKLFVILQTMQSAVNLLPFNWFQENNPEAGPQVHSPQFFYFCIFNTKLDKQLFKQSDCLAKIAAINLTIIL